MDDHVKGDQIPDSDDVARHCRRTDWYRGDNDEISVLGDAFVPDSEGVSVTWVQFFDVPKAEQLVAAFSIIRGTRRVRSSHRLAVINVGTVVSCGRRHGIDLNVEHDPIDDPPPNLAHCLIKGIPADAHALRELLALNARGMMF
jgi:hypothetical protein